MMIRSLLFLLFLYTALVWVLSFYYGGDSGVDVQRGLFYTAAGIAALIAWLIIERVWSWWRTHSAQRTARPVAPTAAPAKPQHPDDVALESLLAEAETRLAESAAFRGSNTRILDLPMYLLLGAEGAGKTSVLEASGMEPVLLAGQVAATGKSVASTRLVNIWLAKDTLYLEISGRIFGGDLTRFTEFVECLRAQPVLSPLRQRIAKTSLGKLFEAPAPPPKLRGVLLFFSTREFIGTPDVLKIEKATQQIRERLDAVAAHFGTGCPVYVLFTKTDFVPFYQDFFSRFSESEANQVFGILNASEAGSKVPENRVWAEAESRRFGKFFNSLFLRLNNRRLLALATEAQNYQKPALYEFPREFKRIRELLVQFLVDLFRPNPLKASPVLRGFFFLGTRQVERSAGQGKHEVTEKSRPSALEVTNIFRSGTEILSPEMLQGVLGGRGPTQMATSWMFVTDFFHSVLSQDRPPAPAPIRAASSPAERFGPWVFGATASLGVLAGALWTASWFSNHHIVSETVRLVEQSKRAPTEINPASLAALDELRSHLEDLKKNDSWIPHWGLYTGNKAYTLGRAAYFRRLRVVLFEGINATLIGRLQSPSSNTKPPLYDSLKSHLVITTKACPVETSLNGVLGAALQEWKPQLGAEQYDLANRQIAYYTATVIDEKELPLTLTADLPSINQAREFLRNADGLDQQLNGLIAQVSKQIPALQVQERIPEYAKVLSGPSSIPGQFTKAGSAVIEKLIDAGTWSSGEQCVTGASKIPGAAMLRDVDTKNKLRYLYYSKYAEAWRQFLGGFRVLGFSGTADAAIKLEKLIGPQSALLGLVKLVAENTNFTAKAGEVSQLDSLVEKAEKIGFGILSQKKKALEKVAGEAGQALPKPMGLTAADVTLLFQPAQVATPPASPVLVSEGNQAYVTGLRALQQQLEAYTRASGSEEKSNIIPAARQALVQSKAGLDGLADKFANAGNQGLNTQLADLLEQPIRFADKLIPANAKAPILGKLTGDLAAMCAAVNPTIRKYPFNTQASSSAEATIDDIRKVFAPKAGRIWQYQQSLAESVVRQGPEWIPGPAKPQASPSLIAFLNQAQRITDSFFPAGSLQPRLTYSLRPVPGSGPATRLVIDGKELNSGVSKLRTAFEWPATSGAVPGATGEQSSGGLQSGFGQYDGIWGVFRLFQNADRRGLDEKRVQWSEIRGRGGATAQKLTPPAVVEIVEFPGGVDLFNARFFDSLRCPTEAVVRE